MGRFPQKWKETEVVFFLKKGKDPKASTSYRPICLLPVLGKVVEKLIRLRVVYGLESNKFLHKAQYGFRECRSTEVAIISALDYVKEVKCKGLYPVLVSVDIKGAFENIQWNFVRAILREAPIDLGLISVIDSYLCNRKVLSWKETGY